MIGWPQMIPRAFLLFIITTETMISIAASISTGMIPEISGRSGFSSGSEAISEMIIVMTSSEVCISPTCRFPINLTAKVTMI